MDRRLLFALLTALALLLGSVPVALADEGDDDKKEKSDDHRGKDEKHRGKPRFAHGGDHWVFHNDQIAVYFKGEGKEKAKPDLFVAINGTDGNQSGYRVKILRLYEAEENSTAFHGRLPHIGLTKARDWNVQTMERNESLTLTMVHAEAQGIVTLVWHINTTSAEVKYDLKVDNWRWAPDSEGHRLVLDMLVLGKNLRNETGQRVAVDESGYIEWVSTARVTYGNGTGADLGVLASVKKLGEQEEDDDEKEGAKSGAHVLLVFDGPAGYKSLDYDPIFGVQSGDVGVRSVPGFGAVALVVAVAGVALLSRRR